MRWVAILSPFIKRDTWDLESLPSPGSPGSDGRIGSWTLSGSRASVIYAKSCCFFHRTGQMDELHEMMSLPAPPSKRAVLLAGSCFLDQFLSPGLHSHKRGIQEGLWDGNGFHSSYNIRIVDDGVDCFLIELWDSFPVKLLLQRALSDCRGYCSRKVRPISHFTQL